MTWRGCGRSPNVRGRDGREGEYGVAGQSISTTPGGVRMWPALWALIFGFTLLIVDGTVVSIATPVIMRDLETTVTGIMWVTSAYLLAAAVPLLLCGRLGDIFGPRMLYLAGIAVFIVASMGSGLAPTIEILVACRAVQGLGAAMMAPQTMAIITRTFPPDRRGIAMGFWGAVGSSAGLLGPILGGVLVDTVGWRWIFFINVPVGIIGLLIGVSYIPRLPRNPGHVDWWGTVFSLIGLFLIVFGIQEGSEHNWGALIGPIQVWMVIAAGALFLVVFVLYELRVRYPLVPMSLFRDRNFSLSNIAHTFTAMIVVSVMTPMTYFLQDGRGVSATAVALLMAPMAIISGALSPLIGKLADRYEPKWIAAPGLVILTAGLLWLRSLLTVDSSLVMMALAIALCGLGAAGMGSPLTLAATRHLPSTEAGAGAGVYNATQRVGSVLGSAAITALVATALAVGQSGDSSGRRTLPPAELDTFISHVATAMWMPVACAVAALIFVLFFARKNAAGPVWHAPVALSPAGEWSQAGGGAVPAKQNGSAVSSPQA